MKNKRFLLLAIFVIFTTLAVSNLSAQVKEDTNVKEPNVSGMFYPDSPSVLASQIDSFLNKAQSPNIEGEIFALISPHAGYIYSGGVAAFGYRLIKDRTYKTIIIIGSSHHFDFNGISVYAGGAFRTPLGVVQVDEDIAKRLIQQSQKLFFYPLVFEKEHTVEVQIPFLQKIYKEFKIVPIITGNYSEESNKILADALANVLKDRKDILVIASTDMSHFYDYKTCRAIDSTTLAALKNFDIQTLSNGILTRRMELCGAGPVLATMTAAKKLGFDKIEILKYANSGDVTPDKSRVVGYVSAVIYREKRGETMLNPNQRKRLLEIARRSIEEYLKTGKRPEFDEQDPLLKAKNGAFVTLHEKGRLRGCIGNLIGDKPLYVTIRDMAIAAATEDPRFAPVSLKEIKDLEIEISVLSPLKRVSNADEIVLGTHGVLIKRGFASGVFLPQVAHETCWTKEEFLSNLCSHKAGLPEDAWKDPSTEIYIFSAEIFSESK